MCIESRFHEEHGKLPKLYGQNCFEKFHLHFRSLTMVQISKCSPFWFKTQKYIKKTYTIRS